MLASQNRDFTFFVTIYFKLTTFMIVLMQDFWIQFPMNIQILSMGQGKTPSNL